MEDNEQMEKEDNWDYMENKASWECHTQRNKLSLINISTEAKYQFGQAKTQNYIKGGTPHKKMCSDGLTQNPRQRQVWQRHGTTFGVGTPHIL